ncbi:hypothetical protein ABEB36_005086 [Hypothenemus hampei]|uniref:Beta-glucuronidase n=1 Tax=Hypothenemus hampei TaxID=57062 RepID=A0ABD1EXD2_HYPHA
MMSIRTALVLVLVVFFKYTNGAILPVRSSETREVLSLDGLWYFTTNETFIDSIEEEHDWELNLMPVPSSYNDISTKPEIRDHAGAVWYKKNFFIPSSWENKNVWIRFGSVCYSASVTVNGQLATEHSIGHLPFETEISSYLTFGKENAVLVKVDNILTNTSIPQGSLDTLFTGRKKVKYTFDFFNYAGIDRPVYLYTTNSVHINDVTINSTVNTTSTKGAVVSYLISHTATNSSTSYEVKVLDKSKKVVGTVSSENAEDTVEIDSPKLWWPYLMNPEPGYLYTLEITLKVNGTVADIYRQPFGIRELRFDNTSFTINGQPIYIRGFGRHEDSDIRGKGLDFPLIVRDYNLIKWIGANCYRTSHYPYAEEIMDLADQFGIMIIDEVPAVNTENYNDGLLRNHKKSLSELYQRDKNRPSVVIWSIANEPRTQLAESEDYYRQISAHIKSLDRSRPITIANLYTSGEDHSGQFLDILGVNRYEAWYVNAGDLDTVYPNLLDHARAWHQKHNKPVLITEYGADSEEGLKLLPTYIWTEEYQTELMENAFRAFDELRGEGWFIGEMIWNFADFKTEQTITRVGCNKKGLFTRNRQPKQAAYLMRKRYWQLAHKLNNVTLPADLEPYISDLASNSYKIPKDEL